MKKTTYLIGITLFLSLISCSSPADYNTSIMDEAAKIEKEALKITKEIQDKNFEGAQIAFQEGKDQTKKSLNKLERMSAFREDDALRLAAVDFVKFYDDLFSNEYQEALDLLKKGEKYSVEEADRLFENIQKISKKGDDVKQNLIDEHLAFVKKYELIIERGH